MTAETNLERRLADHYASESTPRAPDRVLLGALATIESTGQRRGPVAPWRFNPMPMYARLGVAAAAVVAVVLVALWQLAPPGGPGGPAVTPTTAPSPSPSQTTLPGPTAYVPAALSKRFTSTIHGISIGYPEGWITKPATTPWTTPADPSFFDTSGDLLYDPVRNDHLFLLMASQPLSTSFDAFVNAGLVGECTARETVSVAGNDGVLATGCSLAYVPSGGRVYLIRLYVSSDDAELRAFDADAWLKQILGTAQLRPQDAIDTAPTASP